MALTITSTEVLTVKLIKDIVTANSYRFLSLEESDTRGSAQHTPPMYLKVPIPEGH